MFWRVGDETVIDGVTRQRQRSHGRRFSPSWPAALQSGYLYHYAFAMIIGLAALLGWLWSAPEHDEAR